MVVHQLCEDQFFPLMSSQPWDTSQHCVVLSKFVWSHTNLNTNEHENGSFMFIRSVSHRPHHYILTPIPLITMWWYRLRWGIIDSPNKFIIQWLQNQVIITSRIGYLCSTECHNVYSQQKNLYLVLGNFSLLSSERPAWLHAVPLQ